MKIDIKNKAYSEACRLVYSRFNVLSNKTTSRDYHLDMRKTFDKLVFSNIKEIENNIDRINVIALQKIRLKNKPYLFENILQNSIYLDYKMNGGKVFDDRLNVNGRNHWAKNETDKKVLQILKLNK